MPVKLKEKQTIPHIQGSVCQYQMLSKLLTQQTLRKPWNMEGSCEHHEGAVWKRFSLSVLTLNSATLLT